MAVAVAVLLASACGEDRTPQVARSASTGARSAPAASIDDLEFRDLELNAIAKRLIAEAHRRKLRTTFAGNRVERLVALEAALGASPFALDRVNEITLDLTSGDTGPWARLRGRARRDFQRGHDESSRRVRSMLDDWEREKRMVILRAISEPARAWALFGDLEWEFYFHDFVKARPVHAGTWGWLVLIDRKAEIEREYGRADSETAYRYYLGLTRLGMDSEARDLFSVPGVPMP
jgi:hypothetical protein